ncbi:MAG TPA: helix-turn-helix domain-containing protein [Galbitalea sp.]
MSRDLQPSWPLLAELTERLFEDTPNFDMLLADAVRRGVPMYRDRSPAIAEALRSSCEAHIAFIRGELGGEGIEDEDIRQLGRERATADFPLVSVLDALRVGTAFLWAELMAFARRNGLASDAKLVEVASQVWVMNDRIVGLMQDGYRDRQSELLVASQFGRFSLAYSILTGAPEASWSLSEAVDALHLPRDGGYVVTCVLALEPGKLPYPNAERRLLDHHITSTWILLANVQFGIVSTQQPLAVENALRMLNDAGATAGLSPRFESYADAPQASRLARVALASARPGTVVVFAEAPIELIAAAAPDVSSQLIQPILGELLNEAEPQRAALVTVLVEWFRLEGSVNKIARELYVHPNTVRNRMRRIEALTGRSLSSPTDAAELYLAVSTLAQQTRDRAGS